MKNSLPTTTHGSVVYLITLTLVAVLIVAIPYHMAQATPSPKLSPAFDSKEKESTPTPILDPRTYVLSFFPIDEREAVDRLVFLESSWNQYAVNPTSGACGYFQSINCDYDMNDVKAQAEWGRNYILQRYNNAWNALDFWYRNGWY